MSENSIIIKNITDIDRAAKCFIEKLGDKYKIFAFYASMGAGKTTFTTAICKLLGVENDAISSPTFSIVNEYQTNKGDMIYHFDFYRINKIEEAFDIGFYDYIDSGNFCFIEWAENIEEILPEDCLVVNIKTQEDGSRLISWEE